MQWTNESVEFLKQYYPKYGGIYCSKKLNITRKQITSKVYFLELKREKNLESKVCTKCLVEKKISEFWRVKGKKQSKSGINPICKECGNRIRKIDISKNPDKWRNYNKKSYIKFRKKRILNACKNYKKRYISNCLFRLKETIRSRIRNSINGKNKSQNTLNLLGCKIPELKLYLESKFTSGMTWENYGFYGWHIDHIKPCAAFDLTIPEQQRECFHFSNLQPLWATTEIARQNGDLESIGNINKGNRIV